jgi:hypothetical protein
MDEEGAGMACGSCLHPSAFDKPAQDIADLAAKGMAENRRLAVQAYWVADMLGCAGGPDICHLAVKLDFPFSSLASRF